MNKEMAEIPRWFSHRTLQGHIRFFFFLKVSEKSVETQKQRIDTLFGSTMPGEASVVSGADSDGWSGGG